MKTKNAMQLKAMIKKIAVSKNISPQLAMQNYMLETILAEKLETIISRAEVNTRPRDFYDIYLLSKLRIEECDASVLRLALERTSEKRGSLDVIKQWEGIVLKIESSEFLRSNWKKYCRTNAFAEGISYEQTCDSVKQLMQLITNQK